MSNLLVVATIICDHKLYPGAERVLERNAALEVPEEMEKAVYLNIETNPTNNLWLVDYCDLLQHVDAYDVWTWQSSWRLERTKDQDQGYRLPPICIARNMVREFALAMDAAAVLYVDSDVLVPKNALRELWETEFPIVGGIVPGRGCHSHVNYLGSPGAFRSLGENLAETDFSTAGFLLVRREVFERVNWRWGWDDRGRGPHSEDPLFGYETRQLGIPWRVRTDLVAEHLDNPDRPLTEDETA